MNNTSSSLKAFKRATSLELSKWYMGTLTTPLVETEDTNGAFFLVELMAPGTEPPPHMHPREDELFYVLAGEPDVYVGEEAFKIKTGECIFLARYKPHVFLVRSPRLRMVGLVAPGELEEAFRSMREHAQFLELPTEALTYSKADVQETVQRFDEYDVKLVAPDQVAEQLPLYPKPIPPNPGK
jgi:mannose-6-phosphate isomerase-like protein (cupin superfamily)